MSEIAATAIGYCLLKYSVPLVLYHVSHDSGCMHLSSCTVLDTGKRGSELTLSAIAYAAHLLLSVPWLYFTNLNIEKLLLAHPRQQPATAWENAALLYLVLLFVVQGVLILGEWFPSDYLLWPSLIMNACVGAYTAAGAFRGTSQAPSVYTRPVARAIALFYACTALSNVRVPWFNPAEWHALFAVMAYFLMYQLMLAMKPTSRVSVSIALLTIPMIFIYSQVRRTKEDWIVRPGFMVELASAVGSTAAVSIGATR
tara:strand:- start:2986 stop:3753 length:768 start_codon:yes stop_codon:yes gene_type:complete